MVPSEAFFRKLKEDGILSGGQGETAENAVVINTRSSKIGIAAEYAYVEQICGERDVDWNLQGQRLLTTDDKSKAFDQLYVKLKDGKIKEFWFDITAFHGWEMVELYEEYLKKKKGK